jgi:RNA polymerase sigma-70 factor (ECF subfamily)
MFRFPASTMTPPPEQPQDADARPHEARPASRDEAAVRYWGAIYAYIRQAGRRDEEARELTQGFIADVLLGRDLLSKLDEGRGQFRTLLLSAVRNYLADAYRFDHAARRHPGEGRLGRADEGAADGLADRSTPAPEAAFHRAWISMLIRDAADALRTECLAAGRDMQWDLFDRRILRPMLEGAPAPSYEQLMAHWKLDAASQVSNAIVAMRRAFAGHLVRLVGATVDTSHSGARGELREMLALLEGRTP